MWNTIYIKGKGKIKKDIRKNIKKSQLKEGIDYIEGSSHHKYELYWISNTITLHQFKLAITAKCVWKYRLSFFSEIKQKKTDIFVREEDRQLIEKFSNK